MAQTFYQCRFKKQLTGSPCGHANCNMAAAAMAADQATLGIVNRTADQMRTYSGTAGTCTDAIKGNEGTTIQNAANALAKVGIHAVVNDAADLRLFSDVLTDLRTASIIAHGDYDRVPLTLRGDKEFLGFHSVFFHSYDVQRNAIRVGDGLNDGRADQPTGTPAPNGFVWWSLAVAKAYMIGFPGVGLTYATIQRHTLRKRVAVANIRSGKSRTYPIIARMTTTASLVYGGIQLGESIGGDRRWFRVWVPSKARLGYVHASVVRVIS